MLVHGQVHVYIVLMVFRVDLIGWILGGWKRKERMFFFFWCLIGWILRGEIGGTRVFSLEAHQNAIFLIWEKK